MRSQIFIRVERNGKWESVDLVDATLPELTGWIETLNTEALRRTVQVLIQNMDPIMRLENWEIRISPFNKVTAYAVGNVYDSPNYPDGTIFFTSSIVEIDKENSLLKTLNGKYLLGKKKVEGN